MKKIKTMLAMIVALVSMCVVFNSCSKSDDDKNSQGTAQQVAGTYTGDLSSTANGLDMGTDKNKTFKIEANGNIQATITLPECTKSVTFGGATMTMNLPSLEVKDVMVTTSAGVPTLEISKYKGTASDGKSYTVNLKGQYSNNKLTVNYSLQYGGMPFAITFTFTSSSKN